MAWPRRRRPWGRGTRVGAVARPAPGVERYVTRYRMFGCCLFRIGSSPRGPYRAFPVARGATGSVKTKVPAYARTVPYRTVPTVLYAYHEHDAYRTATLYSMRRAVARPPCGAALIFQISLIGEKACRVEFVR